MHNLTLSALYIYPVKSLGGIKLDSALVETRGLQHDRRWMLVDQDNQCLTQRKHPQMALLKTALTVGSLYISKAGQPDLVIPFGTYTGESLRVIVWDDVCEAVAVSAAADAWFSEALGVACRLVYMPDDSIRPVDPRYALADEHVSFADGYPFLLIGEASLHDLNAHLAEPIPMDRFRPNFVINGSAPFAEDTWQELRIGESTFWVVKPCARCVMITIDQQTAQKGKEPLQTLATYRSADHKIYFGQNVVYGGQGQRVRVGDPVSVMSFR